MLNVQNHKSHVHYHAVCLYIYIILFVHSHIIIFELNIFRSNNIKEDTESHIGNDCAEAELACSNDDCKGNIKRKNYDDHVNNQCEDRIVDCKYVKYGCDIKRIKAKDMKVHMNEYKFEHLAAQFNTVTTQV